MAQVSRSGYYKWGNNPARYKDYVDYVLIKFVFEKAKQRIGYRQVQMRLSLQGINMNHKKIRRIMNKYQLYCKVRTRNPYKMIMKKTQEHRTFDNLLSRDFKQALPSKVFCTDITYLYYASGRKAYLSVVKDIASGEVVAWQVSMNIELELVLSTLDNLKSPMQAKTLLHSDQGFHYTSPIYIQRIKQLGFIQSMSRKGNCVDNAPIESFFGHLKDECGYKACSTFQELTKTLNTYMHYYNKYRPQWGLKKMTPVKYRDHLLAITG